MPFVVAETPHAAVQVMDVSANGEDLLRSLGSVADEQLVEISDLAVGSIRYPLRQQLTGNFVRALERLTINGISPLIVGEGESSGAAVDDFCIKVHAAIQELINKRPFEMTEREHLIWDTLNEFVDTTVYRNTTPVIVRQFGRIRKARPYPEEVEWENGRTERITLSDVAEADYVNYRPGQPFEAIVERNPLTFELIRVVHIDRRRVPRRLEQSEEAKLLDEIGSLDVLEPDTEWKP